MSEERKVCDVAVIGAGPGGYDCAIDCAKLGLKTVLIESRELGGTCLNRGCIPTKTLLHSAALYNEILEGAKFGVSASGVAFDYAVANARRKKVVEQLRQGIRTLEKNAGVDVIFARAKLTGAHELTCAPSDGAPEFVLDADKIVIATGSRPSRIPVPGLDSPDVWTSDEFLAAEELPESAVIVGGGVIGIEIATLLGSLGKKVVVLEFLPEILAGFDPELVKLLQRKLKKLEIDVKTGVRVTRAEASETETKVYYEEKGAEQCATGARCIVCAGRRPETAELGLEHAGVERDSRGFIPVDDYMRTSAGHIFAIGDVTGKLQLAHVATAQGRTAARGCAGKFDSPVNYGAIPGCVYTSPELATVGLSEKAARESGAEIAVGSVRVPASGRAMASGVDVGLVKIVADASSGRVLGCSILAPRASDMIAEPTLAVARGLTVFDVDGAVHAHPTFSESIAAAARLAAEQIARDRSGE